MVNALKHAPGNSQQKQHEQNRATSIPLHEQRVMDAIAQRELSEKLRHLGGESLKAFFLPGRDPEPLYEEIKSTGQDITLLRIYQQDPNIATVVCKDIEPPSALVVTGYENFPETNSAFDF